MANAKVWKNVKVSMESALAAAVTITGISNASPGVCLTSTPPTAGTVVLINAPGMSQIDGRLFRVGTVVASTSFALDGEDTTLYDVFSGAASYQLDTLGTAIDSATTIQAAGGDFSFIDTTTIHANQKSSIPGLPNAVTITMDHIEDASDAGQIAMLSASRQTGQRGFKFLFPNGNFFLARGYVGFSGVPTGQAQALVVAQSVITVNTSITKYAS